MSAAGGVNSVREIEDQFMTITIIVDRMLTGFKASYFIGAVARQDFNNRFYFRDFRRPANDDFDDYEYERRPYRSRNRSESRRTGDDRRKNEDRRFDDRRRPYSDDRKPIDDRRRPEDERRSYDDRRFSDDRRQTDDRKRTDEEKGQSDDRKFTRRKNYDDHLDDKRKDRSPEPEKRPIAEESIIELRPVGSLFDRRRVPPKISRPVPLSEKNKFAYVSKEKVIDDKKNDEEYYEDDYEEAPIASSTSTTSTTTAKPTTTKYSPRLKTPTTPIASRKTTTSTTLTPITAQEIEYYDDEYYDTVTTTVKPSVISSPKEDRAALFNSRNRHTNEHSTPAVPSAVAPNVASQAATLENFRLNRFKSPNEKHLNQSRQTPTPYVEESSTLPPPTYVTSRKPLPAISNSKKFANQQTVFEFTTTETPKPITQSIAYNLNQQRLLNRNSELPESNIDERDVKSIVRIVKRPFLPSRGGDPYKGRGLKPVGQQFQDDSLTNNDNLQFTAPGADTSATVNAQEFPTNPQHHRTTLDDIYNEEYDVEINDALNPMLKPLTSSRGISGFSFSSAPIDERDALRSHSKKSIQKAEAPKITTTTTTTELPQYEYEDVEYEY